MIRTVVFSQVSATNSGSASSSPRPQPLPVGLGESLIGIVDSLLQTCLGRLLKAMIRASGLVEFKPSENANVVIIDDKASSPVSSFTVCILKYHHISYSVSSYPIRCIIISHTLYHNIPYSVSLYLILRIIIYHTSYHYISIGSFIPCAVYQQQPIWLTLTRGGNNRPALHSLYR